jgi:hypothetical protein
MRTFVNYGKMVDFIKTNINLNIAFDFTMAPGLFNNILNKAYTKNLAAGIVFASNISADVDFTIATTSNFSYVNNSIQTNQNTHYFNQLSKIRLNWLIFEHLNFQSDLTHQYYSGLSNSYNANYILWNISLGYKFLENNAAELRISAFDVLGQNKSIQRNVTDSYIEDVNSLVLKRFGIVSFIYNLRHFGGNQ